MTEALEAVRSFAQVRYRELYNNPDWVFKLATANAEPSWLWQSQELRDTDSKDTADAGLLLDPEIGVCLYLVDYSREKNVRETISRALAIRQQLLPISRAADIPVDELGSWRVVVCWLVDEIFFDAWVGQIAELREKTGHFEEITTDVIVRSDVSWADACDQHGLPRLLIAVRTVLSKSDPEKIEVWRSADRPVIRALETLADNFSDQIAVQCARQVALAALPETTNQIKPFDTFRTPEAIFDFSVENFRNLENISLHVRPEGTPVASAIIHGPNGSGKSSVFEALSFALGGASMRYLGYLEDRNRTLFGRADKYISDYLKTRDGVLGTVPKVSINGGTPKEISSLDVDDVQHRVADLSATIFSQECSRSLVSMPAQELGAEVASAFSNVASTAIDFVNTALDEAQEQQRRFNAEWGLRGNVIRERTVLEQVALRQLREFTAPADNYLVWLRFDLDHSPILRRMHEYASRLEVWKNGQATIASKIASLDSAERRHQLIMDYLQDGELVVATIEAFIYDISGQIRDWDTDLESKIERLGSRIAARTDAKPTSYAQFDALNSQREKLNDDYQLALSRGTFLRARKAALEATNAILPEWSSDHNKECPTCGSNVSDQGGITHVVKQLIGEIDDELTVQRLEFVRCKNALDSLANQMVELGFENPDSGVDDEPVVLSQVHWLLTDTKGFDGILANATHRSSLIATIAHFRKVPQRRGDLISAQAGADITIQLMSKVSGQFERVATLPVAWKSVRDVLQEQLSNIVAQHLPRTIQAVWNELTQNMLPARWQYPGSVSLKVESGKTGNKLAVVIRSSGFEDALAAHILNGAEVHNLGLSWFLTRYLTDGRFRYSALVMDDPAHSMDQPTYRDFCRLLETLLRLHRVRRIPLSLIVLLHQDSRAVDAARATGGVLHQLRWNKHTPVSLKSSKLSDESSAAPQPSSHRRTA